MFICINMPVNEITSLFHLQMATALAGTAKNGIRIIF